MKLNGLAIIFGRVIGVTGILFHFFTFSSFAADNSGEKLVDAIWRRDETVTLQIIKENADVSFVSSTGLTPLIAAVRTKNEKIIKILLAAGANSNQIDRNGCLALHHSKNDSIRRLLKDQGSWNWNCDLSNHDDSYPELKGCLSSSIAESALARKINNIGLHEYKKGKLVSAEGAWKAAAHLDCNYLMPRMNFAALNAKALQYDTAIKALDEAFALDQNTVVKKLEVDKDYFEFKKSTKFKLLKAWPAFAKAKGLKPLVSGKLPLEIGDDLIDIIAVDSKKQTEYPIEYFLHSKKNGKKFLFNNCRGHAYHLCSTLKPEFLYDQDLHKMIIKLNCNCAGHNCDGLQNDFETQVGIDLKTFAPVNDEFSKEDPACKGR